MDDHDDPYGAIKFGEFRKYIQNKQSKLKEQEDEVRQQGDPDALPLFQGLSIHINGYTEPPINELRRLIVQHAGDYQHYLKKSKVTHIIATNLTYSKVNEFRAYKVVKPAWITDSVREKKLLPWTDYRLGKLNHGQTELAFTSIKGKQPEQPAPSAPSGEALNKTLLANEWSRQHSSMHPDFVKRYFETSRLHYLSTWKAELKDIVRQARLKSPNTTADSCLSSPTRVIMHIDFDCFFASVGLRDRPELAQKPVAVAHGKGRQDNSSSDIASCNYIARSFGVRNGMRVGSAQKVCPDLQIIPYEFEKYRTVTEVFYNILFKYTQEIQAVSVDEALIDVSALIAHPEVGEEEAFAQKLRQEIKEATGCNASVGIGSNILLARLATKKAKPDNIYCCKSDAIDEFLAGFHLRDIPRVGYALCGKLQDMNVSTVGDLAKLSLSVLQSRFGNKTGKMLYESARGKDDRPLAMDQPRQSVSAEVSWGVRFETDQQLKAFMDSLVEEVCQRLKAIPTKGRSITLKVMVRAKHAEEALKHMGHGEVDVHNKTTLLDAPTDQQSVICHHASRLLQSMGCLTTDIRGLGIQIQKLDQEDRSGSQSKLSFEKAKTASTSTSLGHEPEQRLCTVDPSPSTSQRVTTPPSSSIHPAKPKMSVQFDVYEELPLDIRQELMDNYDLVIIDHPDIISTPPTPVASPSPPPVSPRPDSSVSQMPSTQPLADLPTWSQLDPSALLALPLSMQQQVLAAYGQIRAGKKSTSSSTRRPPLTPSSSSSSTTTSRHPPNRVKKESRRSKHPSKNATLTQLYPTPNRSGHPTLDVNDEISLEVLEQLPPDLRKEVIESYRLKPNQDKQTTTTIPSAQLPAPEKKPTALMGKTSVPDVRLVLQTWVQEYPTDPDTKDVATVTKYLKQLVVDKDLEDAQLLFMHLRHITLDCGDAWASAVALIQSDLSQQVLETFHVPIQL
ncbi:DNA repair protein [Hesseltinella vesiculosa]|uniref:DNA repair protein REV1 n=1 Tax=Hesseltinella vesiculosa TaxID=101127 RepID=A0A1X2GCV4_9FUNG|nr:DNA repair protein [Hesseltinella vesiculosa]